MTVTAHDAPSFGALRWLASAGELVRRTAQAALGGVDWAHGVVVQDCAGAIVAANIHAERLLGLSFDQLVGVTSMDPRWQAVSEAGLPLPGEKHPALVALTTGEPVVEALMGVLVPPADDTVWLEVTAQPLRDVDGVCGVIALFRDVSVSARGMKAYGALVEAYRLLAENASGIVFRANVDGTCEWISPSVTQATGWQADEFIGRRVLEFVHADDQPRVLHRRQLLFSGESPQEFTARLRCKNGDYRWFSAWARTELAVDGSPRATVISLRDADVEVRAQAELVASERHYRMLADNSTDVIIHVRDGSVRWVSPSSQAALGWAPADLNGRDISSLVVPDDAWVVAAGKQDLLTTGQARHTVRWYRADGSVCWFDVVARLFVDDQGKVDGAVLRLRDVHAEVESRQLLEYQARHDQLTGLLNRKELVERLATVLSGQAGVVRPTRGIAVAFCDVDQFKAVNDSYGHEGGDRLLQAISARICAAVRAGDVVARLGGDEIVVVLDGVADVHDAMAVAEKIRQAVAEPVEIGESAVCATVSIGVSLAHPGDDVGALVRRADDAVYLAKSRGRNCVATLDASAR